LYHPKVEKLDHITTRREALEIVEFPRAANSRGDAASSPSLKFRRAFLTFNTNKGRSLGMLQMVCGHCDIKTTRFYCKTIGDEMISEMKD
jgi:site-specific recombinase XerD